MEIFGTFSVFSGQFAFSVQFTLTVFDGNFLEFYILSLALVTLTTFEGLWRVVDVMKV